MLERLLLMPSKKTSPKKNGEKQKQKLDYLTKRSVQITGFGFAGILLIIRIGSNIFGFESGISEIFIAGCIGLGASGLWKIK